ncbi:MAG: YbdD/YjiX family protein [Gemmatimonadaceae bacterium]
MMTTKAAVEAVRSKLERAGCVVRRVIGVPDYDIYLTHLRSRHPDVVPPTYEEFTQERQASKYSKPGSRCC